jgi:hypothetical protein
MLAPDRPSPTLAAGVCGVSDCLLPPGHPADLEAKALGYEWEVRDPMPDLIAPFYICAACAHRQAHQAHDEAIVAGYSRPPLTCCA